MKKLLTLAAAAALVATFGFAGTAVAGATFPNDTLNDTDSVRIDIASAYVTRPQ